MIVNDQNFDKLTKLKHEKVGLDFLVYWIKYSDVSIHYQYGVNPQGY